MDCEYVLLCRLGFGEVVLREFHAPTPEKALEDGREIIKHYQDEVTREFPDEHHIVKGELYRQIKEIDGSEFIKVEEAPKRKPEPFTH